VGDVDQHHPGRVRVADCRGDPVEVDEVRETERLVRTVLVDPFVDKMVSV
jgi:hypothetical protein